MKQICSLYKLDYKMPDTSYLSLCDFDSLLADEPVFDGMQELQIYQPIRAAYAKVNLRNNVPRSISFSRIYEKATANEARGFEIDQMTLLDAMVKSELIIEVKDSDTWRMADAVLVGKPREKDVDGMPPEYAVIDYTIYGGELVKQPSAVLDVFVIDEVDYFVLVD